MSEYPFGVDVAFSNELTSARASNLDFAIPRIGTLGYSGIGTAGYLTKPLNVDSAFYNSVSNCKALGKPVGCYIFSYAWSAASAEHEADVVCDYLDANNINLEMPVWYDWERTGVGTVGSYEMVTAAGIVVTPQLVQQITLAFMQRVNARGRSSGWYGNLDSINSFYTSQWTDARMAENYYFWLAQWGASFSRVCDVWQYSGDVVWENIDADLNYLINPRCVNGVIPRRFNKLILLMTRGKTQKKSFMYRRKIY